MRARATRILVSAVTALAAVAAPAAAGPCTVGSWVAVAGTVSDGRDCRAAVLTADGTGATGRTTYGAPVSGTGRFAITLQRLTPDRGSLQLEFPGGYVLLIDGHVGVYTSEAQWADTGYRPLPAPLTGAPQHAAHRLEVDVGARTIAVRVDGVAVGVWAIPAHAATGMFGVLVAGARGTRSRVRISDWALPAPR